jgi:hypothetical protein
MFISLWLVNVIPFIRVTHYGRFGGLCWVHLLSRKIFSQRSVKTYHSPKHLISKDSNFYMYLVQLFYKHLLVFVLHFVYWALRLIFFTSRPSTRNECDLIKIASEASVMLPVTQAAPPLLESRQSAFCLT